MASEDLFLGKTPNTCGVNIGEVTKIFEQKMSEMVEDKSEEQNDRRKEQQNE